MKTLLIAVAMLVAGNAMAINRYYTESRTCADVQQIVQNDGEAILKWQSTNAPVTLYDRFVAHAGYCYRDERTKARYVPTSDTAKCPVLVCVQRDND